MNVHFTTAEFWAWEAQMAYVLVSSDPGVSAKEILAALPTVEDIVRCTITYDELSQTHAICYGHGSNLFYHVAAVCEKLGDFERALHYVDAALSTDLPRGGTQMPIARAVFTVLRGRVLAYLGRSAEAASVLEAAAEMARTVGARLYELYAVRDLKLLVLDPMGHGDHGSRRLGAILRQLKGPMDKLTSLLKGLDAGELMTLAPPDANYRVVYEVEDAALATLREELQGMRLTALQKRAGHELAQSDIDDAMDSDNPKRELVALLLAQSQVATSSAAQEQQKHLRDRPAPEPTDDDTAARKAALESLGLMALHRLAVGEGVDVLTTLKMAMESDTPKAAVIELLLALPE